MSTTPVETNELGQLLGLRAHDATVVGFSYEHGANFALTIKRVDGSRVRLILVGVGRFGFDKYTDGFDILDVFAWEPDRVPSVHETAGGAWSTLFGYNPEPSRLAATIKSFVSAGFAYLVYLNPGGSAGDFAALCRGIEIEELSGA